MTRLHEDPLLRARHAIAVAALGGASPVADTLGSVVLRGAQREAASRLVSLASAHGGALLAEPVGVGKTFTSLAAASALGGRLMVIAPAALRDMWVESLERCAMRATIVSHEELSRGRDVPATAQVVIVDESHRLRTPTTRRYAAVARLCGDARVLLVSATPVQNTRADLAVQLALFLGRRAWLMSGPDLAEYVVRDGDDRPDGKPALRGPFPVALPADDAFVDAIMELPPPVPARDEGMAGALLSYGLLHQWTSSRAALVRALKRRRARGLALSDAIAAGRSPSRGELSAWAYAGDVMQLSFAELVTEQSLAGEAEDHAALRDALDRHDRAIESLLDRIAQSPNPDRARAEALVCIRERHRGERIIAFCHYEETVNALRSLLDREPGIAVLTARGGRVAGGRITRREVLEQFTASAAGAAASGGHDAAGRIDLLITTDLLSEGLNLQEASVIVHLDLPWNPARLDQRVGRARRLGSRHPAVTVYAFTPPAAAERLMQIERRLRDKLRVAQRTVGVAGQILPSPLGVGPIVPSDEDRQGLAEQLGAVRRAMREWILPGGRAAGEGDPCIGAAIAERPGFLALVLDDGQPVLVAGTEGGVSTSSAAVLEAVAACSGRAVPASPVLAAAALGRLRLWLDVRAGASSVDLHSAGAARFRRAALARVARTLARAPRHRRPVLAPLAHAARAVAIASLPEGAERILETLVQAELPDEAWLRSIATFGALNARHAPRSDRSPAVGRVAALILFGPPDAPA